MTDPPGPKPVAEPKQPGGLCGEACVMNGLLDITTAVSLVLLAAFLIAGAALPFIPTHRKARR